MIREFVELAQTDAPSRGERNIADLLLARLEKMGCEVYEDSAGKKIGGNAGNIIARLPGTKPGTLLLCAHMDRVEPGIGVKPAVEGDTISSDGTTILGADDLAGVVVIMETLRCIKESGEEYPELEIVFTVCEEQGLEGSRNLDFSQFKSKIGYVFDTSGRAGRIVNRAPYKGVATIEVFGKASHAGNFPERGVNAIMAAAHILDGLREGRLAKDATSNFGSIRGGENVGTVCDHVVVRGELRNHSKEGLMEYFEYVRSYCEKRICDTEASCKVSFEMNYDGFTVDEDEPAMKLLLDSMRELGIEPSVELGMGGMDANNFNSNGIQSVGVAAGYSDPHSLNERLSIPDFVRTAELACRLVLNFN